jgi:hypothetical protein
LEVINYEKKPIKINRTLVRYPDEETFLQASYENPRSIGVGERFILYLDPVQNSLFDLELVGKDKFDINLIYQYDEVDSLLRSSNGEIISDVVSDDNLASLYKSKSEDSVGSVEFSVFEPQN